MNLQPSSGDCLRTIANSCSNLLHALNQSPEAVLGQIFEIESACKSLDKTSPVMRDKTEVSTKMMSLVGVLHGQMGTRGLMDDKDFAAFREKVLAIQTYANTLHSSIGQRQVRP
jgi:hypothetical protein